MVKLPNQSSEAIYTINLLNQHIPLVYDTLLHETYLRRGVLLPTDLHMIQVVHLLLDYPLIELWGILVSNTTFLGRGTDESHVEHR